MLIRVGSSWGVQQIPDGDVAFLLSLAAAFLAALTFAFFFMYLRQEHKNRRVQRYAATLHNTGNVATAYDLRLAEPSQQLEFQLYHENTLLLERQSTAPVETSPIAAPASKPNLIGAAREVGGFGSALLGILPQPLAKPLQAGLQGLSKSVMAATRADSAVKAGQKLSKKAGGLVPTKEAAADVVPSKGLVAPAIETRITDQWYETPVLTPGQLLEVTILVDWRTGEPGQRYPYRLTSQATDKVQTDVVTTNGTIGLPQEKWWVQALPGLFGISATVAAAIFVLMLAVTVSIVL